jgi:hypothetical protein
MKKITREDETGRISRKKGKIKYAHSTSVGKQPMCYIWSIPLHDAEIWALRKANQKYLESFEMWC